MPRKDTIIRVFLASPDDVRDERDILSENIDDFNAENSESMRVRFDLIDWKRHISPGVGEDAQAVINEQVAGKYDIFIGILWNRIGTPTKRSGSGTIEEFRLAKARYDKDPNSMKLMLYFRTSPPISMDDFDVEQYKLVQEFRKEAGEAGVFYFEFSDPDSFRNHARLDLAKTARYWADQNKQDDTHLPQSNNGTVAETSTLHHPGEGIIELEETLEKEMMVLIGVAERMAASIVQIGDKSRQRAAEIQAIPIPKDASRLSDYERQRLRIHTKRVLARSAKDMDGFVAEIRNEVPKFRQHLDKSIDVLAKCIPIYIEIGFGENDEKMLELKGNINDMKDAMGGMVDGTEALRASFSGFPRLSTVIVRSSREADKILQEVIDIARGGIASLGQVLSLLP